MYNPLKAKSMDYIRFDWAMKRLLRNKANRAVLEGLVSVLLKDKITIERFLESESNQEDENDKFNRVDMLAENSKGELLIIEIQNSRELAYFHRMLYGVSKAITEYIKLGEAYDHVRKVYSINIIYFELGQGGDYIYHGRTEFRGLHNPEDVLKLSVRQQERFIGKVAGDIFPEYFVLRVNDFDKVALTPMDEWMEFLKSGTIKQDTTTPGLSEARECLRVDSLSEAEKHSYYRAVETARWQKSVLETSWIEGHADGKAEGRIEGRAEGIVEGIAKGKTETILTTARNLKQLGAPLGMIIQATGLTQEEIEQL